MWVIFSSHKKYWTEFLLFFLVEINSSNWKLFLVVTNFKNNHLRHTFLQNNSLLEFAVYRNSAAFYSKIQNQESGVRSNPALIPRVALPILQFVMMRLNVRITWMKLIVRFWPSGPIGALVQSLVALAGLDENVTVKLAIRLLTVTDKLIKKSLAFWAIALPM